VTRAVVLLAVISVLTATLFAWNRARSPFLAAEREVPAAQALATEFGVPVAEVLALREDVGVALGTLPWRERVVRWKDAKVAWKSRQLAVLALLGAEALAKELLATSGGDASRAELALGKREEHVAVVRFLSVAERLAARSGG